MNVRRLLAYLAVSIVGVFIWSAWEKDYPALPPASQPAEMQALSAQEAANNATASSYVPNAQPLVRSNTSTTPASATTISSSTLPVTSTASRLIQIKTDVLNIAINLDGGSIVSAQLPKYPMSLEDHTPITILSDAKNQNYVADVGLSGSAPIAYQTNAASYTMKDGQNQLIVQLTGTQGALSVVKTYTFERGKYSVQLNQAVTNTGASPWNGSLYFQFSRQKPETDHHGFYTKSYDGAAISSPKAPYEKLTYSEMDKKDLDRENQDGWVAMQQHYFLSAWIPGEKNWTYHYYSHVIPETQGNTPVYVVGFMTPTLTVQSNASTQVNSTFYVGPEIASTLQSLAVGLDHTIDYGWLWPISVIIFWLMNKIHLIMRNWGWSIIFTTIFIKMAFYWFSAASFRSMAKMRELQPKMTALRERYGDDRQALGREMMALYRKEKVNPMGGCLPVLIQIPVFIALYYVIIESVQLRQAPFMFWIHDLSIKDPYYVLPILMGLSMFWQQKITPTTGDPAQAKMMMILPVIFTVFFLNFPAGLVLYWLVNNCVQVLQQWYVMKTFPAHQQKQKAKQKKKS